MKRIRLKLLAIDQELRVIWRLLNRLQDWSGTRGADLIGRRLAAEKRRARWMRRLWWRQAVEIGSKKTVGQARRIIVRRIRNRKSDGRER